MVKWGSCIVHILARASFVTAVGLVLLKGHELVLANLRISKSLKQRLGMSQHHGSRVFDTQHHCDCLAQHAIRRAMNSRANM